METKKEMFLRWRRQAEGNGDVEMFLYCEKQLNNIEVEEESNAKRTSRTV